MNSVATSTYNPPESKTMMDTISNIGARYVKLNGQRKKMRIENRFREIYQKFYEKFFSEKAFRENGQKLPSKFSMIMIGWGIALITISYFVYEIWEHFNGD